MRRAGLVVAIAGMLVARAAAAAADGPPPAPAEAHRAEAAERYDRAMALLEEGDNAGALAELKRVYEIAPHPQVLYNLGLVYAATNHPVEAARTLAQVLAAPGALAADRLARARRTLDAQAHQIARLNVTTSVPAIIEVDGVAVGKTPLAEPIAVAAGSHVVGAAAPGYLPLHRELTVAGETTEAVALDLLPSEVRLAHLAIQSALPGADVYVDGQRVGQTPLPASLAVPPGLRRVELRRAGYRAATREVTLGDGASGELGFELAEDAGAAVPHGRLALAVSEPDPDVIVDGQPRGAYRGPLSLPPGPHELRVLRAGFVPFARQVMVPEGGDSVARVTLAPTPETRAAYRGRTLLRRRLGWAATLGGAALAAGAGVVVGLNRKALSDAQNNTAPILARPPCSTPIGAMEMSDCQAMLDAADADYNKHKTIQTIGFVAMGVGGAALLAGAYVLLTGEDPDRYDRAPAERPHLDDLALSGWLEANAGGLSLRGGF